jgi:hypothetical protein
MCMYVCIYIYIFIYQEKLSLYFREKNRFFVWYNFQFLLLKLKIDLRELIKTKKNLKTLYN